MFQIKNQLFGEAEEIVLQHSSGTALKCVPDFGANIRELCFVKNNFRHNVIDGFQSFEQLKQNEKSRGIFLIPFPNRIRDGKYSFEGTAYQLPINRPKEQNAIHGFIWNRKFDLTKSLLNENDAVIKFQNHYHGDYAGYPFPFDTQLTFCFTENELKISVAVVNTGNKNMPFGMGWHPYFTFQKNINDLHLQIPDSEILETDERMMPTGERKRYNQFHQSKKINDALFDTCFQFSENKKTYETKLVNSENETAVILWQDNAFRYIQIYIPPERNSIALEPMTCPADSFNSKENLLVLKPNEKFEGNFGVRIK